MVALESSRGELQGGNVAIERVADLTYLDDARMPYHGRSHPNEVRENGRELIKRCRESGIAVDVELLEKAFLLHDALMHLDPHWLGFKSAEELAARFSYNLLIHMGYSQFYAQQVERVILATNPSIRPISTEEIIMRAADLWNVGSHYEGFCRGTRRLHQEAEIRRGEKLPFGQWLAQSYSYLRHFLWPMLELTPEARDGAGRSVWHIQAANNMIRLWRECNEQKGQVIAHVVVDAQSMLLAGETSHFCIMLAPDESVREKLIQRLHSATSHGGVVCVLPGEGKALSLSDESCDKLFIHDDSVESLNEARRVVRSGGALMIAPQLSRAPSNKQPPIPPPTPLGFTFETFAVVEGVRWGIFRKEIV